MRVALTNPPGVKSITPREVEVADVFIGEPAVADGLTDILATFSSGHQQRYTGLAYKVAKKDKKYYPCIIPFTKKRLTRRLTPSRSKPTRPTRRFRQLRS